MYKPDSSHTYRIIHHMVKTFRMWRLIRIVENGLFKEPDPIEGNPVSTEDCNLGFCQLKTIFRRRNYTSMEAVKTMVMADKYGYISVVPAKGGRHLVGISKEGLKFNSYSGLLNEMAGTISNIPAIATLFVSLLAVAISVVAIMHN
jgi:hypothetical protein